MDAEFDKLIKRQKLVHREAFTVLETLSDYLSDKNISLAKVKDDVAKTIDSHKELMSAISKTQKSIDKKFKIDLNSIWNPGCLSEEILPLAIVNHFIREGHFELAATLQEEAGLMSNDEAKQQFTEMFNIQDKLRVGDLNDALFWVQKHSADLEKLGSGLEFQLIRFRYIQLLSTGNVLNCLDYAKKHFGRFSKRFITGMKITREKPTRAKRELL
jgi:hypothetical protein